MTAGTGAQDPPEERCNQWEIALRLFKPCALGCRVTRFLQEMLRALTGKWSSWGDVPWDRAVALPPPSAGFYRREGCPAI